MKSATHPPGTRRRRHGSVRLLPQRLALYLVRDQSALCTVQRLASVTDGELDRADAIWSASSEDDFIDSSFRRSNEATQRRPLPAIASERAGTSPAASGETGATAITF